MKEKKTIGIIPARYDSTRLPGKPLADVNGEPLIYYVWKAASESQLLNKVIIATDDERIKNACMEFGAECIMTDKNLQSGSDRIIAALTLLDEHYDYIINIQGDEPFIRSELIDALIRKTMESLADVGTVITGINTREELFDASTVKVVLRNDDTALYFTRSAIPFVRDKKEKEWLDSSVFWKHIGIYCYTYQALMRFGELAQSDLEIAEKLEQLRLLQDGAKYVCLKTNIPLYGVDTKEDLEKVNSIMRNNLS
jgi:3-deoxy-manno-octulosonate cytidylyltransferase (CMP-KDO synthetase)